MIIAIPKERVPGEHRVAATPETILKMVSLGWEVAVEAGAGLGAYISDEAYLQAGAMVEPDVKKLYQRANIILKVQRPLSDKSMNELEFMQPGTLLIGCFFPGRHPELIPCLNEKKLTCFSLDLLPRLSRAQSMDVLSSMSNIAGYKAVLMAANSLGLFFPMLMTAAGSIPPARVLIIGAGVAGLQAIATARRLGAVVRACDTRPAAEDQVKSLGAEFVSLAVTALNEDQQGYAKAQTDDVYVQQQAIIEPLLDSTDVIITTALIPGQPAPCLISAAMLQRMKPGSVVVDLAAEQGGNCALTEMGKTVIAKGVTIIGTVNISSLLPIHASKLYARNLFAFLNHLVSLSPNLDMNIEDDIIQKTLITYGGKTKE